MPEEPEQFNKKPELEIGEGLKFPLDPRTKKLITDTIKIDSSSVNKDGSTAYTATGAGFKDEDNMTSDSAVATASQQSIKKYVDDTVVTDHGGLAGLADDDHTQYLKSTIEDTTPQLGGDLDLNGKNIDFPTTANISDVKDEDDMASDSATMLATQQSIKKYVDDSAAALKSASGTTTRGSAVAGSAETITVGFQSKAIRITAARKGGSGISLSTISHGFCNASLTQNFMRMQLDTYGVGWVSDSSNVLSVNVLNGGTPEFRQAEITSISTTAFVLTWETIPPDGETAYVIWEALG